MSSLISTPPKWVSYWFGFSTVIVLWGEPCGDAEGKQLISDAAYCFMRPRSMVGGDLSWIWYPYK